MIEMMMNINSLLRL